VAPQRIVSLVPSLTELVWWLGAGSRLAGRTKFCVEPEGQIETVPALGGTKNPSVERITALRPDLVIANREENRREDVEALRAAGLPVLLTDPNSVEGAIAMIRELGALLECSERADELAREVETLLSEGAGDARPRVYVGVWHSPMMGLGCESYGHSLIEACGAVNALRTRPRYPELSMQELAKVSPDLILLPDEPFPFDAGHAALYGQIAPARLVDGKLLWWYGPRMPAAIRELRRLFAEAAG